MFDELGRVVVGAGELIFNVGDAGDCAYLIESGRIEIFVRTAEGERTLSRMGKGDLFGEVALIDCQPRTAAVRAEEQTVLIPISRKLVNALLEKSDPILRHLLMTVLERFRSTRAESLAPAASSAASNQLRGEATQKLALAHSITRALEHNEFEMYYQPICSLSGGEVVGFEALIRWNHPTDGFVSPMDFLWLAEQTGQICELGLWTLARACNDWPELRTLTRCATPFVSVNLSPSQLVSEQLLDDVNGILLRYGMPPQELKLELTETVMVERPELAQKILERLTGLGSSLALDDYGTGHSGLEHLQRYPVATLKIDRAFIAPMLTDAHSATIVRSSIELAHTLGMSVVAEGIEDAEVSVGLQALGCDFGQGWYFGKPASKRALLLPAALDTRPR